jgi:rhamnosyltransferase
MKTIAVIVILYNPEDTIIKKWSDICNSVSEDIVLLFIDNSCSAINHDRLINSIYIPLCENRGIAEAQNIGIQSALEHKVKFLVFFDQDSDINIDYIHNIVSEYDRIKLLVPNIAILGPCVINKETNELYKNSDKQINNGYTIVSALISSGTVVESETIKKVGGMDSKLFIDGVDFEWCWRALSVGLTCVRTYNVQLLHKVGQENAWFMGFPIIISSPFRYYYQYRNWIILLRRSYVPKRWKFNTSVRRIVEMFMVPLYAKKRIQTMHNIIKGLINGLFN